jgi:hypothetical protein
VTTRTRFKKGRLSPVERYTCSVSSAGTCAGRSLRTGAATRTPYRSAGPKLSLFVGRRLDCRRHRVRHVFRTVRISSADPLSRYVDQSMQASCSSVSSKVGSILLRVDVIARRPEIRETGSVSSLSPWSVRGWLPPHSDSCPGRVLDAPINAFRCSPHRTPSCPPRHPASSL